MVKVVGLDGFTSFLSYLLSVAPWKGGLRSVMPARSGMLRPSRVGDPGYALDESVAYARQSIITSIVVELAASAARLDGRCDNMEKIVNYGYTSEVNAWFGKSGAVTLCVADLTVRRTGVKSVYTVEQACETGVFSSECDKCKAATWAAFARLTEALRRRGVRCPYFR